MNRIAFNEARKSPHRQHKMGAVIVKGGNILATGFNKIRPSSLLGTPTIHAEADAILKLLKERRLDSLAGSSLYVTRFTRGGVVGCSHPCDRCMSLIRSVGIRTVFYNDFDGTTKKVRV